MAKRNKQKQADETLYDVAGATKDAADYFESNKALVLGVIGGLVLLIGGFFGYNTFVKQPQENTAKEAIFRAEQQFQRDSFALALDNPGGGYEGLLDIIDNYSGTETANLAKLYAGISYLNVGRYEDAISYLESYSPAGAISPILKNGNLGDAHSELGDFDKALSFYDKAVSASEDALLTPYYLYKAGLLAKRNGDSAKSKSYLQKIKDKYPNSEEGTKVDRLLANLQ